METIITDELSTFRAANIAQSQRSLLKGRQAQIFFNSSTARPPLISSGPSAQL